MMPDAPVARLGSSPRTSSVNGSGPGPKRLAISEDWTPFRQQVGHILRSSVAESVVAGLICFNFVVVVVETNSGVDGGDVPSWVRIVSRGLLLIYVAELALRLYVWRCQFFFLIFNVMDFMIVGVDVFFEGYGLFDSNSSAAAIAPLRLFRLARLARGVKVITQFPQLALLVKGMGRAMSAIFWGCILLTSSLTVFAIMAVHAIHPLNKQVAEAGLYEGCDRCERAFASVGQAMLTFVQQIIAGDSWGLVTIPIIELQPISTVFFAAVYVVICLAIMNVILSVIVDSAMKVSQDDIQEVLRAKNEEFKSVVAKFESICKDMDADGSGDLNYDEFVLGYKGNADFNNQLEAQDIKEEDLQVIFDILDKGGDGRVDYHEFAHELFRMKADSMHTLLVFIRFYVVDIRKSVNEQLRVLKSEILEKIDEEREETAVSGSQKAGGLAQEFKRLLSHQGPEEKQVSPRKAEHLETASSMGEELRRLRDVISEDLVNSMKQMVQESESHTRILASMAARDFPGQLGGILSTASARLENSRSALAPGRGKPKPHPPHRSDSGRSSWAGGLAPLSPSVPGNRGGGDSAHAAERRLYRPCEGCCVATRKVSPERLAYDHH